MGVGATAALWTVALLAVAGGQGLLRVVPLKVVRHVTAGILLILAGVAVYTAVS